MNRSSDTGQLLSDECGCKLAFACVLASTAWIVCRHIWGAAELWTLDNLWLVLGAALTGKLVGFVLLRRRSTIGGRATGQVRS